ncbi:MAG: hypothetical protein ABJA78_13800 [Ferruginibacter sp.]
MKKIIPLIYCSCFLSHVRVQAQVCDATTIMNVKGKWTTNADNIVSPDKTFPVSQYSQLKTRLDKIAMLFKETYPEPAGMEAVWYRSIRGTSLIDKGPVPYQFNSLYEGWYCNQNLHKMMLATETSTWSYVYANDFGWLMTEQWDKVWIKIDGVTAFLLPKTKEQWKGLPLYEPTGNNKSKAILLTRNNQLPYKPVSRLSYLNAIKQQLENDKQVQMDALNKIPFKTEAEEAVSKQKGLENALIGAPSSRIEERKERYLKNYKTDKEQKEENRKLSSKYFDDKIKIIDDILKNNNSDELQQPAIIDNVSNFKGFSTLEKGGRMIVVIEARYFNMQLPRYVPQFIVLYWQWDNGTASQNFKKQLEENFPLDKLKAMIDK